MTRPHGSVTIYGAGIAGLSAAHELAERGFQVRIVEPARDVEVGGATTMAIGGVARTQYAFGSRATAASDPCGAPSGQPTAAHRTAAHDAVVPGEHGFRFFPSYYRHLFDTMQRIPVVDASGGDTGRTVYDHLRPSRQLGIVPGNAAPIVAIARSPARTIYERIARLTDLVGLGYDLADVALLVHQIVRLLGMCPKRRAIELEDISFWEYLQGQTATNRTPRHRYSARFQRDIELGPRILAAFDGAFGDARTAGDTFIQLLLDYVEDLPKVDGTLDAPTTEAWFAPWRDHLAALGVVFVPGELTRIELIDRAVRCHVRAEDGTEALDDASDYVVVATDLVTAERVTTGLPAIGVPGQLRGYTTVVPCEPFERGAPILRDPHLDPGIRPWDRLQTISGVQYFFESDVRLFDGYLYFADAPWALSAITSHQFWRRRPALARDGYRAVLSVDVGAWRTGSMNPALGGRPAWRCTEREIADEVWRQITAALPEASRHLPTPRWHHVDRHLGFDDRGVVRNLAPYLIPIKGDWKHRPGAEPWDPTPGADSPPPHAPHEADVWQARHGGQLVHWDKLVFAGAYVRTFTRMTTMEAANEAARHAVNAILDHTLHRMNLDVAGSEVSGSSDRAPSGPPRAAQSRTSPLGDYCRIWNPEHHEHPAFDALRRLDEALLQVGLGHPMDVLGPAALASLAGFAPDALGSQGSPSAAGDRPGAEALLDVLQRIREALEHLDRGR